MILVTGGAGFIGSNIVRALNEKGLNDIIIVDHLGSSEKWKNLIGLKYQRYYEKDVFEDMMDKDKPFFIQHRGIDIVIHMGACSNTTESDSSYLVKNNYNFSVKLFIATNNAYKKFIYASSGATYGHDAYLADDNEKKLENLQPLNMYGYSKHMFDLYTQNNYPGSQCVGLKYFNVFGPGESHKGNMSSYIYQSYNKIAEDGYVNIFSPDGSYEATKKFTRDFIYIKDVIDMTLFFFDHPEKKGIFNIGSGITTTWEEVAEYTFEALQTIPEINYVRIPHILRDQYQWKTLACINKLRNEGYNKEITSLKDAINDYINYLVFIK